MNDKRQFVLIVEDDEVKWRDVEPLVKSALPGVPYERARSLVDADRLVDSGAITFMILDISMNIAGHSTDASRGVHANLGGVEIAERMWLLGIDVPTVVLTGFDYFKKTGVRIQALESYSLEGLETKLRSFLGPKLLCCIKYGSPKWQHDLTRCLLKASL